MNIRFDGSATSYIHARMVQRFDGWRTHSLYVDGSKLCELCFIAVGASKGVVSFSKLQKENMSAI